MSFDFSSSSYKSHEIAINLCNKGFSFILKYYAKFAHLSHPIFLVWCHNEVHLVFLFNCGPCLEPTIKITEYRWLYSLEMHISDCGVANSRFLIFCQSLKSFWWNDLFIFFTRANKNYKNLTEMYWLVYLLGNKNSIGKYLNVPTKIAFFTSATNIYTDNLTRANHPFNKKCR